MNPKYPPFAEGTLRPDTFVQWKGTDVCVDVYCVCGDQFHIDGYFAYAVRCPHCQRVYELAHNVDLREINPDTWDQQILTDNDPDTETP